MIVKILAFSLITGIQVVLLMALGLFLGYLGSLAILAFFRPQKRSFPASRVRRFAVVVPAHNEEISIGHTLKNLKELEYPERMFDVVVIADNCNDRTTEIAKNASAEVLERTSPLRGKGYALRWCFDQILARQPGYEGIVVIDADSTVAKDFLVIMNYYLDAGAKAVQCSDLVDPGSRGWSASITLLSFLLSNRARPLGRSIIGCSPGLKGNGMCFAAETLRRVPWGSFTLSEDHEYGLELLLNGFSIEFAPEAALYAKMPLDADNARSQRARWESGRLQAFRTYGRRLIGGFFRLRKFKLLDAWIELVMPPLVNMLAFAFLMAAINAVSFLLGARNADVLTLLWMGVVTLGVLHVIAGLAAAGAPLSSFLSLINVPRYLLWKAGIYLGLARKGHSKEWVRTYRETMTFESSNKP